MLKNIPTFSKIRTPSSYPASQKRFFQGNRADLRVPYREISLSATLHSNRSEENPPVPVYDTSGPYTAPDDRIDLTRGLACPRMSWIKERDDTEILSRPSSEYARLRENHLLAFHLRFPSPIVSRRAPSGKNVSQMHYARRGMVTPEMEFVALRESMRLEQLSQNPSYASLLHQHKGSAFGAQLPEQISHPFR